MSTRALRRQAPAAGWSLSGIVNSKAVKILYRLTMPGSMLLGIVLVLLRLGVVSDADPRVLSFLPLGIFLCGLMLAMAFRRSRLFFALLVLTLGHVALALVAPRTPQRIAEVLGSAVAVLLPMNLLVLAFVKERGIISPAGRRRLAIVAGQILAVTALCLPQLEPAATSLNTTFFPEWLSAWSGLSQLGFAAFASAGMVVMVPLIQRYRAVESSLLWALASIFIALCLGSATAPASLFFSAAGMVLIVALLETSYRMAYHDELTQLPSRRALNEALMKLPSAYTLAMVDVDHFKRFNDNFGHEAGDQALRLVASRLAHIAGGGRAYRYGGEEFAIVFPGKAASEVVLYLDRMRKIIEQTKFVVRGKERRGKRLTGRRSRHETHVTVSIGVASCDGDRVAPTEVLRIADKALYRAKSKGRNCTVNAKGSVAAVASMSLADAF